MVRVKCLAWEQKILTGPVLEPRAPDPQSSALIAYQATAPTVSKPLYIKWVMRGLFFVARSKSSRIIRTELVCARKTDTRSSFG